MGKVHYYKNFVKAVSKRTGLTCATLEVAIPAVFDELRWILCESDNPCLPIESFGTFAIIDIPERDRQYTYKGKSELRHLPAKQKLKFSPTRNMRREIEERHFDESRQAFVRHPDDPPIRKRGEMQRRKKHPAFSIGPKAGLPCDNEEE